MPILARSWSAGRYALKFCATAYPVSIVQSRATNHGSFGEHPSTNQALSWSVRGVLWN